MGKRKKRKRKSGNKRRVVWTEVKKKRKAREREKSLKGKGSVIMVAGTLIFSTVNRRHHDSLPNLFLLPRRRHHLIHPPDRSDDLFAFIKGLPTIRTN